MDEGNVGKDLALKQKQEFEKEILEAIKELKTGETTTIGGMEITNYGGQATIKIEGIDIAFGIIDENGNFTYNRENLIQAKKVLEEEGITFEELGFPDIEQWIDLEEQERDEMGRDERSLSTKMREEKKPEREEPEQPEKEKDDDDRTEIAKAGIKRDSSWIEIRADRETDEMRTFMGMIKREYPDLVQGDNRLFIAPNPKDPNDYNLYAMDKSGKTVLAEIPLEHTEGKNSMQENVITYGRDGSNAKTAKPIQMLKIGKSHNNAMIMIYNGTRTGTEVHIGVRSEGDNYQSHKISGSMSQNEIDDATEDVKYATSSSYAEREDGDREARVYETLARLEKQGVPDRINPAKDNNAISVTEVENYNNFTATYAAILMKEYGISKECAADVAVRVLDEGEDFDKALKEGILEEEKAKEAKGTIPPGSAEHLAEGRYNAAINGNETEEREEEQEKLPGQKRGI